MTGRIEPELLRRVALSLANDSVTCAVLEGLRARGVRVILLKGPSLRRVLYDPTDVRVSADIDLLVDERSLDALEAALADLGCRYLGITVAGGGRRMRRVWIQEPTGIPVEIHTTVTGMESSPADVWAVLSEETETEALSSCTAEMLNRPGTVLHVVLNVAHHGRANTRTRADLDRALERVSPDVWQAAAELARRVQALPAFAAGLRLDPRGEALLRELGVNVQPTPHVALRAETAPPLAQGLGWLTELPTARARIRFVVRSAFPPPDFMRVWAPSTRRGPIWLAAAYCWRPFWMLGRLPRALRALRRARRAARR